MISSCQDKVRPHYKRQLALSELVVTQLPSRSKEVKKPKLSPHSSGCVLKQSYQDFDKIFSRIRYWDLPK